MDQPQTHAPNALDERAEERIAWRCVLVLLVTLTIVKPVGSIPVLGAIALTFAAALQLYLPIWRMDKLDLDYDFLGLHRTHWRRDAAITLKLCMWIFIPYVVVYHFYVTEMRGWAMSVGWVQLGRLVPQLTFAPQFPESTGAWLDGTGWFLSMVATHILGVALPEETFYRGYLQPRLAARWPAKFTILGVQIGRAAVLTSALFALGHFLGEWNPLRLAPFIPSLIFAWQRNATGSILGAIAFHGLCNILAEILAQFYQPL